MEIEDSVIVITGGSRGVGAATGRLLAMRGARIVLSGRDNNALDAVGREITEAGGEVAVKAGDVTRANDMVDLVETATDRFGRLDAFIANAGISFSAPLAEGRLDDWNTIIDVNLRGLLHGIAAVLPVFNAQRSGHFISVNSTASRKWLPGSAVYAASKAGALAACESLRQEVGPDIRVTVVSPGFVNTDFIMNTRHPAQRQSLIEGRAKMAMDPTAVAEAIAFALAQPSEVDVGEITLRSAVQP